MEMWSNKRRSANMLEKGKWGQIVLVESKTIVWITHLNRILHCARDSLRPVSLREFVRHSPFSQTIDAPRAQQLALQLQKRLQERSGMFQFSDLSAIPPEPSPAATDPIGNQPEEEPPRRMSRENVPALRPEEIAVPESVEGEWESSGVPTPSSFAPDVPMGENDNENGVTQGIVTE